MHDVFHAVPVADQVYWVGAVDWGLRDFHGYSTSRGTTYNAFLVTAGDIALIDTVKGAFCDEMLARIASVCDPGAIRYIVSNHAEMDHSGGLPQAAARIEPEKILTSKNGVDALTRHFGAIDRLEPVENGGALDLDGLTLQFFETRMLHWPESMVTYALERKTLFSQDAFGMHLASAERFADEIESDVLRYEAAKYFANILMLYAPRIPKVANQLAGLDIGVIAPDHGPIWRKDPGRIVEWYLEWAEQRPAMKAVVVFDTMWGSTAAMARAAAEGLGEGGVSVRMMPLSASSRSDVATELLEAGAVLVGSPTLNNQMFPTVADLLCYMKGLRPKNLIGAAFGSYGWSGNAVKHINAELDAMKVERVNDGLEVQYVPTAEHLEACRQLGLDVAAQLKQRTGAYGP